MDSHLVIAAVSTLAVVLLYRAAMVSGDENEYRLIRDLMRNYDSRVRPSLNSSEALNVTFGLALAQIIDVDEKNQIITTNCWLNQAWIDFKLRWDPDRYGGIRSIRLPWDSIWKPDIILYNNADVSVYKSSISTNVIVSADGNVTWLSMMIFKSSCTIDVKYFPFDEQNCTMLFASWTYDGFQVNLIKVGENGDVSNYIKNSEWTLVHLHVVRNVVYYSCCQEPYPDVTYTIQMRRKPLFYVFNMILPCMIITLVALLGFYIPSDSGEKVTMGITTLLSMTVFLMLVAESMPPTSDVLPLIGLYYGITIAIVSFATAMTVLTLNIHHKGLRGREVPAIIKKIFIGIFAKLLCLHLEVPDIPDTNLYQYDGAEVATAGHSTNNSSSNSSYIKLKQYNNRGTSASVPSSTPSDNTSRSHMTVLDFVPSREMRNRSHDNKYDMSDHIPENGGLSPRFSQQLHHAGLLGSPNLTSVSSSSSENKDFERHFVRVLQKVYQTIEKNEIRLADQDRRETIRLEWQQVALVVDRILLIAFIILLIGVTCGIMFQAPHTSSFIFGSNTKDADEIIENSANIEPEASTAQDIM